MPAFVASITQNTLSRILRSFGVFLLEQTAGERDKHVLENEKELVARAQNGDRDAFSQLYNHYFPQIYAFLMRRCGHQQITEDLTSQVFLKAFAKLPKYRFMGHPFGAWIYRIANNTLTDHYRKASTNSEYATEHLPERADDDLSPHGEVLAAEEKEKVLSLVAQLGEEDQKIIHLKFFAELSVKEIAAIVEMSPNAVSVRIYRAVKRLKKVVDEYET